MRKILILIALIAYLSPDAGAQLWKMRRYEASASFGSTQFYGDIGGFSKGKNLLGIKDIIFKQTRYNITGSIKYRIIDVVSVRFNFAVGEFHATDAKGSNERRGYESTTSFFEPALIGEYYLLKNKGENSFLHLRDANWKFRSLLSALDIYTFAGLGGLSFKVTPNDKLAARMIETKGFTPVIPIGIGVDMFYNSNFNFGIEFGGRYAFSDKIDGYTSVYSKSNDMYHFLNFSVTYKIITGKNGLPSFSKGNRR